MESNEKTYVFSEKALDSYIKAIQKLAKIQEREECAMLCEAEWSTVEQKNHSYDLAKAIRERGHQ